MGSHKSVRQNINGCETEKKSIALLTKINGLSRDDNENLLALLKEKGFKMPENQAVGWTSNEQYWNPFVLEFEKRLNYKEKDQEPAGGRRKTKRRRRKRRKRKTRRR